MKHSSRFASAIIIATLCASVFQSTYAANIASEQPIGGQRDAHGCLGPAGYTWSAPLKQCIRTWEHYSIDAASPNTGNTKLDSLLSSRNNTIINRFRTNAEEQMVAESLTGATGYELEITHTIVNTGSIASVEINTYEMTGGAHGLATVSTITYNTKTGKIIPINRILSKKQLETVSKNVGKELAKRFGSGADTKWIAEGLSVAKASNYRAFTVQTDKNGQLAFLTIYTNEDQVGPHAVGIQSVKLAWPSLEVVAETSAK